MSRQRPITLSAFVSVVATLWIATPALAGDLALDRPARASSVESGRNDLRAELANDGNPNTRWASAWSVPQWWSVDLGGVRTIDRVELNWHVAYASGYRIETRTSGGRSWSTAVTVTNSSAGLKVHTFRARSARYVRVYVDAKGTQSGASLWDAHVCDGACAASPPPTPAPSPTPSPTPTPTPTPGAWPDASSTGVPAGTALATSGALTIGTAGAVIDAREITGGVVVNAPNVTIRRSRIRSNAFRAIVNNSSGLVIEDSEIVNRPVAGQPNCHNGIGWGNFTLRRTEVTGCENAADVGGGNVVLEDNYIHDLDTSGPSYVWGNSPHTDGVQGSGSNVVVRRNWIDPAPGSGANAGIMMGIANPVSANYRIEGNYIDGRGASYAIYAPRVLTPGVVISGNRLLKGYGYTACVRLGVTVQAFTDNRDAITGALLSADNGFDGGCSN